MVPGTMASHSVSSFAWNGSSGNFSRRTTLVPRNSATGLTLLGFVDAKRPAVHVLAVEFINGLAGAIVIHLDEAEAARATGFTVEDDTCTLYRAELGEEIFEFLVASGPGQVAHVNVHQ